MTMTEEHKAKMAEGRKRAAAQKKAEGAAAEKAEADAAAAAADAQAQAVDVVAPDTSALLVGGAQEWGPFDKYQEVHTPYGLFGLSANTIMHFEVRKAWHSKEKVWIDSPQPVYREAAVA